MPQTPQPPGEPIHGAQHAAATEHAQQAVQHHGAQYNTFIGAAQARSLAAVAPSIAVPQPRVAPALLRGRTAVLRAFDDRLRHHGSSQLERPSQVVVVLHGLGGCGKTTIALQIARAAADAGIPCWWVPAGARGGLRAALHAVAFDAGADAADFDRAHPADVLWRRLDTLDRPWLLVIDDVTDPATLTVNSRPLHAGVGWVRPSAGRRGLVLITSRDGRPDRWAPWITMQPLQPLEPDDAARVLLDLAPHAGSRDEARALAVALGGLPLALDLAGRYLAAVAADPFPPDDAVTTFSAYQNSLERVLPESADPEPAVGGVVREQRPLLGTWEISLDLLAQQGHDLARPLMWLLSGFGAAPLPYRIVLRPGVLAQSALFPDPTPRRLSGALRALAGLGLVTITPGPDVPVTANVSRDTRRVIELHPLVRTVTRANLRASGEEPGYRALLAHLLDVAGNAVDPEDPNDWGVWARIAEHCAVPLRSWSENDAGTVEELLTATALASRAAWYRYMAGLFEEAAADFEFVLDVCRSALGDDHPETLRIRNQRGRALRERGQHDLAETEFRATLTISRRALGDDHPETLRTRSNLARTLRERGQPDAAERELRAALPISRRALGDDHPDTLSIRQSLARLLRERGAYDAAAAEYRSVLERWRARFGDEHIRLVEMRYELAEIARGQRAFPEAEREFRAVVSAATRALGAEHPNTLVFRTGLARTLRESGQPEAAREEFREILRIHRRRLGDAHPDTRAVEAELER